MFIYNISEYNNINEYSNNYNIMYIFLYIYIIITIIIIIICYICVCYFSLKDYSEIEIFI